MWKRFKKRRTLFGEPFDPDEFDLEIRPSFVRNKTDSDQDFYTWELSPYCREYGENFPHAAIAVAKQLFSGLHVLTYVHAFPDNSKRRACYPIYSSEEMLLQTYCQILQLHELADTVYFQMPGTMIAQTEGMDIPLSTLLFSGNYGELFDYHAYGFGEPLFTDNFVKAKAHIDSATHVLKIEYQRSPDLLYIQMDRQRLPPAECLTQIQTICEREKFRLDISPELIQYAGSSGDRR